MSSSPRLTRRGFVLAGSALAGAALLESCSSGAKVATGGFATLPPTVPTAVVPTAVVPTSAGSSSSGPSPSGASSTTLAAVAPVVIAGAPATYVNHGDAALTKVALTFHLGGDTSLVTELLDLMKSKNFNATFFAIGAWLKANPSLGHRAVADGHELANHTLNHKTMGQLTRSQVFDEIAGGGEALVPFIGSIGKWFRPSGTDVPDQLILDEAGRAGYGVSVGYDVDSRDFKEPGSKAVIAKVNTEVHAGAIVSLHFGHRDTINALPAILDRMAGLGLTQSTVTGLLG